jgi:hypothetical protein
MHSAGRNKSGRTTVPHCPSAIFTAASAWHLFLRRASSAEHRRASKRLDARLLSGLALAGAKIGAPPEQHTGDDPMVSRDQRDRCVGLFCFEHDQELFLFGEDASWFAIRRAEIGCQGRCQGVLD